MKNTIKTEQKKWAAAMALGDVAEMVRCSERLDRLTKDSRILRTARLTLVLGGVL